MCIYTVADLEINMRPPPLPIKFFINYVFSLSHFVSECLKIKLK